MGESYFFIRSPLGDLHHTQQLEGVAQDYADRFVMT